MTRSLTLVLIATAAVAINLKETSLDSKLEEEWTAADIDEDGTLNSSEITLEQIRLCKEHMTRRDGQSDDSFDHSCRYHELHMATVDLWRYNENRQYTWTKDQWAKLRSDYKEGKIYPRGTYADGCKDNNIVNGRERSFYNGDFDMSCHDFNHPYAA